METTCGIFLFLKDGRLLLGHITNTKDRWSIPKGLPDPNEEYLDAAKREMFEETNVKYDDLKIRNVRQNPIKFYKNGKKKLFSVTVTTDNEEKDFKLNCHSMVTSGPTPFPEIDGFTFVTIEEALKMDMQETQKEVLRNL